MSNNKQSKWHRKINRCFSEIRYIPLRFTIGVKNLWKWFPIIWKDRDYDHDFIFEILKYKLHNVANHIDNIDRFVDSTKQVRDIRICVHLIQKIQDGSYTDEMHEYWETKMRVEKVKNSVNYSMEFDDTRDDLHLFLAKYPNDVRRALKSSYLKDRENPTNKQTAIITALLRENRAKSLLFKIMDRNITTWWD